MKEMKNLNSRINCDMLRFLHHFVAVSGSSGMVMVSVVMVSVLVVLMFSSVSLGVILHTVLRFLVMVTHFIVNCNANKKIELIRILIRLKVNIKIKLN
jgi:hypothetical protein